jgi:hypothetical protein
MRIVAKPGGGRNICRYQAVFIIVEVHARSVAGQAAIGIISKARRASATILVQPVCGIGAVQRATAYKGYPAFADKGMA